MNLLVDANILLDVLQKREPHYENSSIIWKLCETKQANGFLSALTFANIVYVLKKELSPEKIEETLSLLSLIFTFTSLDVSDMEKAAAMKWNDFEDAIQTQTAIRVNADFIITRNVKDFTDSPVPACTPTDFLDKTRSAG